MLRGNNYFFWKERDSGWRNVRRCSTNLIFSLEFLFMEHFIRIFRAENFNLYPYEKSKEKFSNKRSFSKREKEASASSPAAPL